MRVGKDGCRKDEDVKASLYERAQGVAELCAGDYQDRQEERELGEQPTTKAATPIPSHLRSTIIDEEGIVAQVSVVQQHRRLSCNVRQSHEVDIAVRGAQDFGIAFAAADEASQFSQSVGVPPTTGQTCHQHSTSIPQACHQHSSLTNSEMS